MRSRMGSLAEMSPHPGTPDYMSPEQRDTYAALQPPSDIYALGLILFEMLAGKNPYYLRPGTNVKDLQSEVSEEINSMVSRMLEKEPEKRLWDGGELLDYVGKWKKSDQQEPIKKNDEKIQPIILKQKNEEKETKAEDGNNKQIENKSTEKINTRPEANEEQIPEPLINPSPEKIIEERYGGRKEYENDHQQVKNEDNEQTVSQNEEQEPEINSEPIKRAYSGYKTKRKSNEETYGGKQPQVIGVFLFVVIVIILMISLNQNPGMYVSIPQKIHPTESKTMTKTPSLGIAVR